MFEYISQHPIAGVALVLLAVLTVFVCIKAMISGRKRSEERERIIAEIEREKALRKEFKAVDEATFSDAQDNYRLIIGMCAHIQQKIENVEDMNAAFNELSDTEKFIYALGYVFEDSRKGLSEFFRANGEPLLGVADCAVKELVSGRFAELFNAEYIMLDENDETTSVDNNSLMKMDDEFRSIIESEGDAIYKSVADYIRSNKEYFI